MCGCVDGNGDNWVELLVTDNIASIQGWKVSWKNSDTGGHANNGSFVFSNSSIWTNLKAGTLITVHYNGDASYSTGYSGSPCSDSAWWIDAAALDTSLIVDAELFYNTTLLGDGFKTDNDNWQVKIEDAATPARKEVLAWVGEGVSGISGVGEDEVCKLEQSPTYGVGVNYANYNDGDCSTFGGPNVRFLNRRFNWLPWLVATIEPLGNPLSAQDRAILTSQYDSHAKRDRILFPRPSVVTL
jgi:hypothetical protein